MPGQFLDPIQGGFSDLAGRHLRCQGSGQVLAEQGEDAGGVALATPQDLGQGRQLLAGFDQATTAHQGQNAQQMQMPVVGEVAARLGGPVVGNETLAALEQTLDHLGPFSRGGRGPQGQGIHAEEGSASHDAEGVQGPDRL